MQLFELNARATLERVTQTFCDRGDEYGDTWKETRWLTLQAVAQEMGIRLNTDEARLLAAATLCDIKYWRLLGGLKEDSLIDGIAYQANLVAQLRETPPTNPADGGACRTDD